MRCDELDLFDRAVALERLLNDRRARLRCSASGHPAVVYVIDGYDNPGDDTLVPTHRRRSEAISPRSPRHHGSTRSSKRHNPARRAAANAAAISSGWDRRLMSR
jgi:hypothetical protein